MHKLRPMLPNVPFLALTATATTRYIIFLSNQPLAIILICFIITKCPDIYCLLTFRVRQDIIDSLALVSPYVHVGSFDRPNLYYGAKCCDSSKDFIDDLCSQLNQRRNAGDSTIVYCATVRDAEDVRT